MCLCVCVCGSRFDGGPRGLIALQSVISIYSLEPRKSLLCAREDVGIIPLSKGCKV